MKLFRKIEFETVEVESNDPTVSCVPVAMRAVPFALDVMIEFAANDVAPVPPYMIPIEVVAETTPLFACRGPFNPEKRFSVPMLATVDELVTNDE